jgi:hypothetical protein
MQARGIAADTARRRRILLLAALTASLCAHSAAAGAATCASLLNLTLQDTTITAAEPIPAGIYTAPDGSVFPQFPLPSFCRIAATLAPTSDSNIKIEVWMPFSGWRGGFWGTGNGSIGGTLNYNAMTWLLSNTNQAIANTDLGTSPAATQSSRVLIGHPEKQIDYATRSTHLMTVRAKEIIKAFYGEPPARSYFYGCSTGGGQGLHEALQFPGGYDAITAGAPAMNRTHLNVSLAWNHAGISYSARRHYGGSVGCDKRCGPEEVRGEGRGPGLGQLSQGPATLLLGPGFAAVPRHAGGRAYLPDSGAS